MCDETLDHMFCCPNKKMVHTHAILLIKLHTKGLKLGFPQAVQNTSCTTFFDYVLRHKCLAQGNVEGQEFRYTQWWLQCSHGHSCKSLSHTSAPMHSVLFWLLGIWHHLHVGYRRRTSSLLFYHHRRTGQKLFCAPTLLGCP